MSLRACEKTSMDKKVWQDIAYTCVYCGGALRRGNGSLSCERCSHMFKQRGGIPILAKNERYWCNVPRDKMRRINDDAESGNWRDAISKHLKGNVVGHISDERRIDFRYILPSLTDKRVLDIGSMWGGVSVPIARYAKEVHAVDMTYETLRFLSIRTKQDNIDNVKVALASGHDLPFKDNYFDVVFMIGVLEWLGSHYDFVVTEHFGKTRLERPARTDPKKLQMRALQEAFRTLKPGGVALIAIENRFFYKHFFGASDPHTAVPFSSILPRPVADLYMRILKNQNYSEYTYSYMGYKKMLKEAGFDSVSIYAAMPSYREVDVIIPLDTSTCINYYYENYGAKDAKGIRKLIPWAILKMDIMKYFVPSFLILAEKR